MKEPNEFCKLCDSSSGCSFCKLMDNCLDCMFSYNCKDSSELASCDMCISCEDCTFCSDCKNLINGFMCQGLKLDKAYTDKYWICNSEVSKKEYYKRVFNK